MTWQEVHIRPMHVSRGDWGNAFSVWSWYWEPRARRAVEARSSVAWVYIELTSLWIGWIASQIGGSPEAWLQMQCTGIAWRSHRMETPDRWIARGPSGGRRLSSRYCFLTLVLSLLVAVRARRLLLLSEELCVPLHSSRYLTGWRDRSEAAFLNATAARRSGCSHCAFAHGTWRPGWSAGGGAAAGRLVGDERTWRAA
eukprot:scaffold2752_cov106-Isochrysis_galbana.AAC.1